MTTDPRKTRVQTWEQLTLGGGFVRFHSETVGRTSNQWECEDENCDDCRDYMELGRDPG